MASLNEYASLLAERAGRTFDVPFQQELKFMIKYWAIRLLKNSLEKNPLDRKFFLSRYVDTVVKLSTEECIPGCYFRTANKVPPTVRVNNILFDYVGSADFNKPYQFLQGWQIMYYSENRYTKNSISYQFVNDYLYFHNFTPTQKYIGVQGIFQDNSQLVKFNCDQSCDTDDEEFPISADIMQIVISSILSTELKVNSEPSDNDVQVDSKQRQ